MTHSDRLAATVRARDWPAPSSMSPERSLVLAAVHALQASLRSWCRTLSMDERTRFLAQASDMADLETRVRRWDEADRRQMGPPL